MTLSDVKTVDEFQALAKDGILVAHFYADWAAQCEQMNDVMVELSKQPEYQHIKFVKCPAEDIPEVSLEYKISAVPTIVILQGGVQVDRIDGANPGELSKKIATVVSKPAAAKPVVISAPAQLSPDELNNRLKSLINAAPVMLFMKGTAQEPRCGFSRQVVALLNELKAEFKTFDILNDEQVRQGLKEYSKWPTYPQLYVNGDLVGGLDILKELNASGELASMLPKKVSLEDRLKALVNKAPVMVFMKGNRDTPRCGFSRTLISILKDSGVEYETFDILEDEEVRQGLKTFSNWPTYPQVYVKGELIGGLDIIQELQAGGELAATLKANA